MTERTSDTAPEIEALRIEGFRRMDAAEKLRLVMMLNEGVLRMAEARIRATHGDDIGERELRLRLASLWLDPELMTRALGWNPVEEGY